MPGSPFVLTSAREARQDEILGNNPRIDWFEVISENYMLPGSRFACLIAFASATPW